MTVQINKAIAPNAGQLPTPSGVAQQFKWVVENDERAKRRMKIATKVEAGGIALDTVEDSASSDGNELLHAQVFRSWEGGASFSLRNRLYRMAWSITWALLASWTPPLLR
ncbi:MAG: hypothetical protein WA085_06525, partial [Sphingobium sp.]